MGWEMGGVDRSGIGHDELCSVSSCSNTSWLQPG